MPKFSPLVALQPTGVCVSGFLTCDPYLGYDAFGKPYGVLSVSYTYLFNKSTKTLRTSVLLGEYEAEKAKATLSKGSYIKAWGRPVASKHPKHGLRASLYAYFVFANVSLGSIQLTETDYKSIKANRIQPADTTTLDQIIDPDFYKDPMFQ